MTVQEQVTALVAPATDTVERNIVAVAASGMDETTKVALLTCLGAVAALTNAVHVLAKNIDHP